MFEFAEPRLISVKGRVEPVPVYRVIHAYHEAGQAQDDAGAALVRRAAELAWLREALDEASKGHGQRLVACIDGRYPWAHASRDFVQAGLELGRNTRSTTSEKCATRK